MLTASDGSKLFSIIDNDDVDSCIEYMKLNPSSLNSYFINYGMFGSYRHCMTPLHYSLKKNAIKCSHFLLESENIDVNLPILCSCGNCENKHSTAIYFAQTKELIQLVLTKYDTDDIDIEEYKRLFNRACHNLSFDAVTFWVSFFETNTIVIPENYLTAGLQKVCESLKNFLTVESQKTEEEIEIFKFLIEKGADVRGLQDSAFRNTPLGLCIVNKKKDLEKMVREIYAEKRFMVPSGKFPGYLPEEYICTLNGVDLKGYRMSTILRLFSDVDIKDIYYNSKSEYSRDFIKALIIYTTLSEQYLLPHSASNMLICETSMVLSPGQKVKITDIVPKDYIRYTDIIRLSHNTIITDSHNIIYDSPIFFVILSGYSNAYVSLHKSITKDTLCHFDVIYLLDPHARRNIINRSTDDVQNNIRYFSGMFYKAFTDIDQTTLIDQSTLIDRLHTILK